MSVDLKNTRRESLENDVLKNIYSRRSVRDYLPDDVPDDIIRELIRAGTYAPTAANKQPWRFVVIKNRELIKKLSNKAKELWMEQADKATNPELKGLAQMVSRPGFDIFFASPLLIMIFSHPDAFSPRDRLRSRSREHDAGSPFTGNWKLLDRSGRSIGPGAVNHGRSGRSACLQARGQSYIRLSCQIGSKCPQERGKCGLEVDRLMTDKDCPGEA